MVMGHTAKLLSSVNEVSIKVSANKFLKKIL